MWDLVGWRTELRISLPPAIPKISPEHRQHPASQHVMKRQRDQANGALAKSWIYDFATILRDLVGIRRCSQAVGAGGPEA
jgi:hypothetical protein